MTRQNYSLTDGRADGRTDECRADMNMALRDTFRALLAINGI
jgi:hypothetical protein